MKLLVTATTTTATDAKPTVTRFFYNVPEDEGEGTLAIDAADFSDDTGAAVTELPALSGDNSYYNVYINGVLQMNNISTYTSGASLTGKLEITIGATETILEDTAIVLEVANFAPNSQSSTDVIT